MATEYTTFDAKTSTEWSGVFKTEHEARSWARSRTDAIVRRITGNADGSESLEDIS